MLTTLSGVIPTHADHLPMGSFSAFGLRCGQIKNALPWLEE
jgi:hypothetical protein